MKKLKQWISWYFRPQERPMYPTDHDSVKKLKKKVKNLEKQIESLVFKIEGLENELMIIMKEHRSLINALDARIDILKEDCGECMKS